MYKCIIFAEDDTPLKETLKSRITYRIKRSAVAVFVRQDFKDIGGYDQVGRVLRELVKKQILIRLGYGIYARARKSSVTGNLIPEKSLPELSEEALKKLGVKIVPASAQRTYNSGLSTQVPTGRVIGVKGRISREISYNGKSIVFEQYA